MNYRKYSGGELRSHRIKLGLNQGEFWRMLGVTQSGGSRYEREREIPEPIQILLNVALGTDKMSKSIVETIRALSKRKTDRALIARALR